MEQCDDGGSIPGDGWSGTCTVEAGYTCAGGSASAPDVCQKCGDGRRTGTELCDDGGIAPGELPEEELLLGYSMGGLTAFEMAKWLEENGVKVKKLIILDKTAQPEYGKIVQKVDLKGELMEIARQIAADPMDYNRIIDYLRAHESLIEAYQQQGLVSCPIEVFYCAQGFELADFLKWQRFSSAELKIQSFANCSHYEIPKIWNELSIDF